jgi:hypothetical protein
MNKAIVLLLPVLVAGCAGSRFAPLEGMPAALGETVSVGSFLATPRRLLEDSRCPLTVQCVQAGRVVVSTQIAGPAGTETVPLVLGEPYPVQGTTVTLVSARPEKWNELRRPRIEYRFVFRGG